MAVKAMQFRALAQFEICLTGEKRFEINPAWTQNQMTHF
jgi:hypothetical protein